MRYLWIMLLVAGCATKPIVDVATPTSISVRYAPLLVSPTQATETAKAHCDKYGKTTTLMSQGSDGDWSILLFHCT